MKTVTREFKVFTFAELSEETREKVLQDMCDLNTSYEWWDCTYEDAKNIGLNITSFDLDRNRSCQGEFLLSADEVSANIFREHGEKCETFKTALSFMEKWTPLFSDYIETEEGEDNLIEAETDFLNSILKSYSIMLQEEYDYLISNEAVIETIEANEYEFLEDGKLFI